MNQYMFTCPAEKQNYEYFCAGATIAFCMGDQDHKYLQIIVLSHKIQVGLLNKCYKNVCMNVR